MDGNPAGAKCAVEECGTDGLIRHDRRSLLERYLLHNPQLVDPLTRWPLVPKGTCECLQQRLVGQPVRHSYRGGWHTRLAPEEQRPVRSPECGVYFLKLLSVPFQSNEERGVAEVDAAADDHVVPFSGVVGSPEAARSGGVVVGAKLSG